jgi:hypothetical protein
MYTTPYSIAVVEDLAPAAGNEASVTSLGADRGTALPSIGRPTAVARPFVVAAQQAAYLSDSRLTNSFRHPLLHERHGTTNPIEQFQASLAERDRFCPPIIGIWPSLHKPKRLSAIDQFLHPLFCHVGARRELSQSIAGHIEIPIQIEMHHRNFRVAFGGKRLEQIALNDSGRLENCATDVISAPSLFGGAEGP